jgi:hypothetical protein
MDLFYWYSQPVTGAIYVLRTIDGNTMPAALALADQWAYKEWVGCFSAI